MKISNCVSQNYFNLKTGVTHIIPTAWRKLYISCRSWTSVDGSRSHEIERHVNEWYNNSQTTFNSITDVTSINKWTKNDIKNPAGICEGRGERRHATYYCRPTWSCLVRCDITHLKGDLCYRILVWVQECCLVKCRLLHESSVTARDLWGKYGGNKQNY